MGGLPDKRSILKNNPINCEPISNHQLIAQKSFSSEKLALEKMTTKKLLNSYKIDYNFCARSQLQRLINICVTVVFLTSGFIFEIISVVAYV